ncbi:aldehyde dehydrogenase, thermostable [bacterium BMS3Bbin02]|nr:aldehyde dehydrogenase, thermostable [bacterium BMS3Bbin02]
MARSGVFIDGSWTADGPVLEIFDPSDTRVHVDTVVSGTADDLRDATQSALAAEESWRNTTPEDRAGVLRAAAQLLRDRANWIATAMVSEEGKTFKEARGEAVRAAGTLDYHADQALSMQDQVLLPIRSGAVTTVRRRPVGPVAVISPFNFPLLVPAWKIGPALAHGNTVVWKPSPLTPLTSINLMQLFDDAGLPRGVLNMVVASGEATADGLIGTPGIKAVTFTGSTAAGRAVQARLAGLDTRVQLEMGGNGPAIVLAGVDVGQVASEIARGAFASTGQRCTGIRRVIVVDQVEDFENALVAAAEGWNVGPGMDPTSDIGPLVSAAAQKAVRMRVDRLRAAGCAVLTGGDPVTGEARKHGHYVHPCIVTGLDPTSALAGEEIFGPVVVVYRVESPAEAFRLANATSFGLSAAVFSSDASDAMAAADSLQFGTVNMNFAGSVAAHVPFLGWGDSGFGPAEQGETAVEFFTRTQVVNVHGDDDG